MQDQDKWVSLIPTVKSWENDNSPVEGYLLEKGTREGQNDQMQTVYTIKTTAGYVLVFGTVRIDQGLQKVQIGAMIRITYIGHEKTARGYQVKQFYVEIAGQSAIEVDFGELIDFTILCPYLDVVEGPFFPCENGPCFVSGISGWEIITPRRGLNAEKDKSRQRKRSTTEIHRYTM